MIFLALPSGHGGFGGGGAPITSGSQRMSLVGQKYHPSPGQYRLVGGGVPISPTAIGSVRDDRTVDG